MIHVPPALKYRSFALIWIGLMISIVGSQMQQWALFWHISQLSKDPIAVSIVGGVRFVAVLLFSLVGGLVADRYNRKTILFLTQSTSMLIALALGLLTLSGDIQLWHIYALTGIQAAAMAFDLPARQSLVPNLVPREVLPSAFSLQSIAFNTGSIAGPALSGVVIGYLGQEYVYLINSITFLAVIVALILMGPIPQTKSVVQRGLRRRPGGYPRRCYLHSPATVDPFDHDPRFHRHLFLICQHAFALFCAKYYPRRGGGLWLAGGCLIDWSVSGGFCRVPVSSGSAAGAAPAGVGCAVWHCDDRVRRFTLVWLDLLRAGGERRRRFDEYDYPQHD